MRYLVADMIATASALAARATPEACTAANAYLVVGFIERASAAGLERCTR